MNRNTGLIATIATALLCGCPGLASLCWGIMSAVISFIPGADINMGGNTSPQAALFSGLGGLCLGIVFIAIPVIVGFVTLRKKPEIAAPVNNDPLPPAS
jgi:hypothetical protein